MKGHTARLNAIGARNFGTVHGISNTKFDGSLGQLVNGEFGLSGRIRHGGVSIIGVMNPRREALFQLAADKPVQMGTGNVMGPGGFLTAHWRHGKGVLVRLSDTTHVRVPSESRSAVIPCRSLSVARLPILSPDEVASAMSRHKRVSHRSLPKGRSLKVYDKPEGSVIAVIKRKKHNHTLYVIEDVTSAKGTDEWEWLVFPRWSGALTYGWVKSRTALAVQSEAAGLGIWPYGPEKTISTLQCEDALTVFAARKGREVPVGKVEPSTLLHVVSKENEPTEVDLGFVSANEEAGWAFRVHPDGQTCRRGTKVVRAPYSGGQPSF